MTSRILVDITILLSILYLPWWITVFLVLIGIFLFKNFYEGVFAGFLLDSLYGTRTEEFAQIWFIFTASFLVIYILAEYLKKSIRLYDTV